MKTPHHNTHDAFKINLNVLITTMWNRRRAWSIVVDEVSWVGFTHDPTSCDHFIVGSHTPSLLNHKPWFASP